MEPAVKSSRIQIQPADEMLVEQARGGRLEAYEEIFHRYRQFVYEYAFLMVGDERIAEKVLLKSFIRFYQQLPFYRFHHKILPELFKISFRLLEKSVRKDEISGFPLDPDFSSKWQRLSLEEQVVMILGKKYGLNLGAVSWILERKVSRIIECFERIELQGLTEVTWPYVGLPSNDYRVVLRSRIQRLRDEKKSYLLFSSLGLVLIFFVVIYGRISPHIFSPHQIKISHRTRLTALTIKDSNRAEPIKPQATEIPLQKLQVDRQVLFVPDSSFAEESFVFVPGRGKVLTIDYELFKAPSQAGLQIILKPTDFSRYLSLNFYIRGDTKLGVPRTLLIQFESKEGGVVKECVVSVSEQWKEVRVPLEFKESKVIQRVALIFKDSVVGLQKSGRVYLDKMVLTEKLK